MTKTMRPTPNIVEGKLFPGIVRYSIPVIITGLLQLLFHAADLVVVGQLCGSISVAAVGATASLNNLLVNCFIGLSVGVGIYTSQAIGAKDDDLVHRIVHSTLPIALLCGAIVAVIGVSCSEIFLTWMGTPTEILSLSAKYIRIIFCGAPLSIAYNFLAAILRASGDTKKPMIYLSISGVVNVILNVVFVVLFRMNVEGVALATILSQAVSVLLVLIELMRRTDACRLVLRKLHFHLKTIGRILALGIPACIQSCVFSLSNVIIQSSVNSFGPIAMSGNAAAASISDFVYIAINAFYHTALTFAGQNIGAKQYDRVKRTLVLCSLCSIVVGLTTGFLVWLFGPQLLSIYITDSTEAIRYGMIRLTYLCLPYFGCGLMEVACGVLRGMGASITSMVLSIVGVCGVRIVWIYTIFAAFHNLPLLYLSYIVSWVFTTTAMWVAFSRLYRKYKKLGVS